MARNQLLGLYFLEPGDLVTVTGGLLVGLSTGCPIHPCRQRFDDRAILALQKQRSGTDIVGIVFFANQADAGATAAFDLVLEAWTRPNCGKTRHDSCAAETGFCNSLSVFRTDPAFG